MSLARALRGAALALAASCALPAQADSSPELCDRQHEPTAAERDTILRLAAVVKDELEASGAEVALVARSGTDLRRFGQRYSHAGVVLRESANAPWSVRQLYYACDERRPRLYDQGMAGFLTGASDLEHGRIALVFLPAGQADPIARVALDDAQSLAVLGSTYSANAYPFSTRYQNCNQWVMELVATAWGGLDDATADVRAQAQAWLEGQDYEPTEFQVPWHPLEWIVGMLTLLHNDDHPPSDLAGNRYTVSMPASIEAFVQAHVAGATRLEICHVGRHIVLHSGWDELGDACEPTGDDRVIDLSPD
ncbi:MAG TPA: DUF2145 domain-containing protein [Burkholderiaceae bacterium]|nr:DUF2145 domain-containing protein [Burkholderiaceae bacterium]